MLRVDLDTVGIPYRDDAGLVFDFHALRCQTATLLDAAGVSPRTVQKIMRHSTLELTGRYTRPRTVDIEAAASKMPSLRPEADTPEALAATGTDPARASATQIATLGNDDCHISKADKKVMSDVERIRNPGRGKVAVAPGTNSDGVTAA
jgi:hypothetical protein